MKTVLFAFGISLLFIGLICLICMVFSIIMKKSTSDKMASYVLHTDYSEMPIKSENVELLKNDGFRIIEE